MELVGGTAGGCEVLAVPVFAGCTWGPGAEAAAASLGPGVERFMEARDFSGKAGSLLEMPGNGDPTVVVFVGLGDETDVEGLRRGAGALARATGRSAAVATTLHQVDVDEAAAAVALGFLLGGYRFDDYQSDPTPSKTERLVLVDASDVELAAVRRAGIAAEAVAAARDLVNEPAGVKPPAVLATRMAEAAAAAGVRTRIYREDEIDEAGFAGLAGVSAGSHNPPRLVELWWEPAEPRGFIAFVGKGIVFDSGGLSLKTAKGMETMKTDMSGAAAVAVAVTAIAQLQLPVKVLGVAPLAENMPGGGATRPGDILRIRNGKSIEVVNTDAEGRLVLADGLALACEQEPDLVVDIATLTGSTHVALGDDYAGLWASGEDAADLVLGAAQRAGEKVWRMPLVGDYRKLIDSDIADMKNSGGRYGGAITAALLLSEFVDDRPWAHLDIAGPARASTTSGYIPAGGTGFGVRTLIALAEAVAET